MSEVLFRTRGAGPSAGPTPTPAKEITRIGGVVVRTRAEPAAPQVAEQVPADKPGIVGSFINRGVETAVGAGSLALDAAKSATSIEGQATFLPRLAKGLYEGAVDAGAGAIARQFPNGMDNLPEGELLKNAARGGAAAVPFVGPYVMNKVSDIEEGHARKVIGETLFDAVTAGATRGTPKAAPPALAKMRAMGGELVLDARDVARSKIWGPAMGGAIGAAVGGPVGSAVGLGAELIYSTRYARKAKAEKALAKAAKAAEVDSIKAATTEVRLIESAEKNSAKATKLAETDSMKSGGIEARILEASQKTQAAVQQELAVATERVRVATVKNRAKAEADLQVAQAKAEAAAKRVADAQERAEAAQIRREFKQRTQLDRQAAKAQKSSPAPASAAQTPPSGMTLDAQGRPLLSDPATFAQMMAKVKPQTPASVNIADTPAARAARREGYIKAGDAAKALREGDAAINAGKAAKAMTTPVDMKRLAGELAQGAKDGLTRSQAIEAAVEAGLTRKFAIAAVERAEASGARFKKSGKP